MMRQLIDETSSGKKDFDVTHRLLMPGGSVKFVHVLSHALKDAAGDLEIVGALMDVTENTRLYRDLEEREARVRRLINSNIIGIFIWEAEGRILEANDAFLHIVGYDRKDLVSGQLRWTDLAPAEWRERDERALAERNSTGKLQPYEKEYFRKDGSRVPALMGAANFEESGNQGVAFVLDLTERKKAEDQRAAARPIWRSTEISHTVPRRSMTRRFSIGQRRPIEFWDVGSARSGLPDREADWSGDVRASRRLRERVRNRPVEPCSSGGETIRSSTIIVLPAGTIKHVELTLMPKFCHKRRACRDCLYTH